VDHDGEVIENVVEVPGSADAAAWLTDRIIGFGESVLSIVPSGFEAYARVFHPACPGGSFFNLRPGQTPLTWAEVAKSRGTTVHRAMQWPSLIGTYTSSNYPRAPDHPGVEPATGELPLEVVRVAMELLKRQTRSPERCWFAVWEGFGRLSDFVTTAPTFDLPHRHYYLLVGPIEAVLESVEDPPRAVVEAGLVWPHYQSPNLWWPDDRAWCVATELDMQSTYIGGSRACVDQLLREDRLEVYEVQPSDGITRDADGVNPKPDEPHPWDISGLGGGRPCSPTDAWRGGLRGWRSRGIDGDNTLGVAGDSEAVRKLPGWAPVGLPTPLIEKIQSWNEYRMGVWRVQILLKDGRIFRPVYVTGDDVTKVGPAEGPFLPIPFSTEEIQDILKDPDWSD
jgi:hypothetical protein